MISLKNISKKFKDFSIQNVSLNIKKGEYFVLLGPSGAGKTLILEIMAGLIRSDSGKISGLDGKKKGLIYQDYMLFPHLDVFHNIAYGLTVRKIEKEKIISSVENTAEELGIAGLLNRQVATLSGGEKQRAAIARALVIKPDILLLDEPTAALDYSTRTQIQTLFLKLHRKYQSTFIHVTHDFEEALALGDRIALLIDGQIVQAGAPDQVFKNPATAAAADFLGYKNIFSGEIKDNFMDLGKVRIFTCMEKAEHAYIAIRSDDIILSLEHLRSSARNSFPGKIIRLIPRLNSIEAVVDAGVTFYAEITQKSQAEMNLREGSTVWVTFKATSIRVFPH
jgi:molybdopterin-binding protein